MEQNQKSSKVTQISDLAFERDKKKADVELRDYFVNKNRQIKAAELTTAISSSLKKNVFSTSEARTLTDFLAKKFDIRGPAIQYSSAGFLSTGPKPVDGTKGQPKRTPLRRIEHRSNELFQQLFSRLQSAVQENLLEYNGARNLVREIVSTYPASKNSLLR